jgi:predicted nucleic acid-binding protein
VALKRLVAELGRFTRIGLDSSVLIYHLEDVRPYSDLTEGLFAAIGRGAPAAVLSTISVAELLVKPWRERQPAQVTAFERFVVSLPNASVIAPDVGMANEAARLRAAYGIRLPDALLVATARRERAQAFVTNDRGLRRLKGEDITVVVLDDYV